MSMFHLDYPRRKGFFHWDELACLARALGFPGEIFYNNIPDEYLQENEDNGLKLKEILFLITVQKCFNRAVDRTINIHTDEWNLCVIQKALHLVDVNALTFEELYNIRVAFQVYENADTKGLPLTEKTLQRTIKLCNRMISPLKMMQRIKHMKDDFEEDGRIQLHEFLDLILWCEIFEELQLSAPDLDIAKLEDEDDLYNIENFEAMLTHYDELLAQRLNSEYRAEELTFVKAKHQSKAMPKDVPPVDPEKRKKLVKYHKENFQYLQNELQLSARNCHQTKAGYVRGRPITAPDLIMYDAIDMSARISTLDPRPATVFDTIGHLIRPLTPQRTVVSRADIQNIVPRPDISRYQRSITPAAVSPEEKMDHFNRMKSLGFETAILDHKYSLILDEEMKEYMPGYKERKAKQKSAERPVSVKSQEVVVPVRVPDEEATKRMAEHKREPPRPAHGKACDARHRGWHKARVKRGSHYILTEPFFEKSHTGLVKDKLSKTFLKEGNLDSYTHTYTRKVDIVPDKPKSRAKKALQPLDVQQLYRETQRPQETNQQHTKKGLESAPHKGSKLSVSSTGKSSSEVSWRHLKLYKEDSSESLNNNSKPKIEKGAPEFETGQGKVLALGTVGKVEVLEQIKEESGRTTRQSGQHGKSSKTPLGMSQQFSKTIEEKLMPATVEEEFIQKLGTHPSGPQLLPSSVDKTSTPPTSVSLPPVYGDRSKVVIQTPRTQVLTETLGLSDSFIIDDGAGPLKASTAKGAKRKPANRKENRKKQECMQRLTERVDGIVSSAMRRKLLSVDLSHLALPIPGKQMWGKGVTLVGMDSRPTTVS